jgi:CheY-like chemotaxis protein
MGANISGQFAPSLDDGKPQEIRDVGESLDAPPWVLVVDDDEDTRQVLRMALEDESYRVIEASNGRQALSLLCRYTRPMVVILDQRMPGLLGTDVLDEALGSSGLYHTRAYILLTASPHRLPPPYSHQHFQRFIPVVGKPMELDDLLEAVSSACKRLRHALPFEGNE